MTMIKALYMMSICTCSKLSQVKSCQYTHCSFIILGRTHEAVAKVNPISVILHLRMRLYHRRHRSHLPEPQQNNPLQQQRRAPNETGSGARRRYCHQTFCSTSTCSVHLLLLVVVPPDWASSSLPAHSSALELHLLPLIGILMHATAQQLLVTYLGTYMPLCLPCFDQHNVQNIQ